MAYPLLVCLVCWTLVLGASWACDLGDVCVAVRPCDNAHNIGSLDRKLDQLQAALNSLKQHTNAGKITLTLLVRHSR